MILMREELGEVLRHHRVKGGKTLRQVATKANMALGYLSEVERGQKEVSSELLLSVANALNVPVSELLIETGERLSTFDTPTLMVPHIIPEEFVDAGVS